MLAWDAAAYNEYVRGHNKAVAQLKQAISDLSGTSRKDGELRQRLYNQLEQCQRDFQARTRLFWYGEQEQEEEE
jgi:hypothetical protein